MLDVGRIREGLVYTRPELVLHVKNPIEKPRIILDATATTPAPIAPLEAMIDAAYSYAPFERGGSESSFETSLAVYSVYNLVANLLGADSWKEIVFGRNTTEMIAHVANALKGEFEGFPRFKSGQNIVTTYLEHNSNYLPWRELVDFLKAWGVKVELRMAKVNPETGEIDMADLSRKVDGKTRLVAVTGKSNVLATVPDLAGIGEIAHRHKALYLVDAAQLVPGHFVDVKEIDADFLAFSFHKMYGPFGVGALYAKGHILEGMRPFLPGGGTVNDVYLDKVDYYDLPQRFMSGSPDSLGIIASGESLCFWIHGGLNMLGDGYKAQRAFTKMVLNAPSYEWDNQYEVSEEVGLMIRKHARSEGREDVISDRTRRRAHARELIRQAMENISEHEIDLTAKTIEGLKNIDGVIIYGNLPPQQRYGLVSFNVEGFESRQIGFALTNRGIELRADQHCAHILHRYVLNTTGSVRVSLAPHTTCEEVDMFLDNMRGVIKDA